MAKTDLSIPGLLDLRDTLPGDAYSWGWVRPLSEVRFMKPFTGISPIRVVRDYKTRVRELRKSVEKYGECTSKNS